MPVNPRSVLFGLVLPFLLSTPSSALAALHRQPLTAQPQDPFATPKFQVSFLNRRPISESEAQAWQENITTGQEFDPVEAFVRGSAHAMMHADAVGRKTIGESTSSQPRPNVVKLRLPSPSSATGSSAVHDYLCLVPSPPMLHPSKDAEAAAREEAMARAAEETPDPNIGWESLQHLNGRCLYTRQGWFSYSYCHNSHVRQFREAPHSHPHPPGGLIPQEDHEYEGYNLGLSPSLAKKTGKTTHGSVPDKPEVSVSRNAHARYLTQTWSSGTICDKTGLPRKVEIQFHCKMGGVDHIGFIKEVSTCKYVLVIYTPNLCSLPGFSSATPDDTPVHPIQCRRIVADGELDQVIEQVDLSSEANADPPIMDDELTALDRYPDLTTNQAVQAMERERKNAGERWPTGYYPFPYQREHLRETSPSRGPHDHARPVRADVKDFIEQIDKLVHILLPDDHQRVDDLDLSTVETELDGQKIVVDVLAGLAGAAAAQGGGDGGVRAGGVPKLKNKLRNDLPQDPLERAKEIKRLRDDIIAKRKEKKDAQDAELQAKDKEDA